ncbi:RidA family protein [Phenylobacterium sp.]|uniref:RidA family protein n=1 Tax=Phenylobacterium sp. TaxID=1871053 RepID=UPI0030030F9C
MTVAKPIPSLTSQRSVLPEGWPRPKGFSNGMLAYGPTVFIGGQIGWDVAGRFPDGFVPQVRQALANICDILVQAGAGPEHLVRMTWYVTDMNAYLGALKEIGAVYRELIGPHYPAMALVQVVRLVEPQAVVEIEATAVLPSEMVPPSRP